MTIPRLHGAGRFLKDERGRTVILHGVNCSGRHKQPPHVLSPDDLLPLRDFGFNVIRLVMVWEAIEPEPGRHDLAYLDRVAALSAAAGDLGMHVILDMHQDLYSRAFGGSGAPAWAIAPADLEQAPRDDGPWFLRYATSSAVRRSLVRFFGDEDGLQQHFIGSLARAARHLARQREVIGCEIFNEPFAGDIPFERFETEHLQPFYQRAIATVLDINQDWLIFFEGALLMSEQGTRLDLGPRKNLVYYPHFYDKQSFLSRKYGGDQQEMQEVLGVYEADAARLGIPWMLGEYGIPVDAQGAREYLRDQEQALERHRVGGTVWHYNPTGLDWNDERMSVIGPSGQETPLLDVLVRPYPRAVSGEIQSYRFDDERRSFQLRYLASGDAESLVFVPRRHYPNGPQVQLSGAEWSHTPESQLLVLRHAQGGGPVSLEITPR